MLSSPSPSLKSWLSLAAFGAKFQLNSKPWVAPLKTLWRLPSELSPPIIQSCEGMQSFSMTRSSFCLSLTFSASKLAIWMSFCASKNFKSCTSFCVWRYWAFHLRSDPSACSLYWISQECKSLFSLTTRSFSFCRGTIDCPFKVASLAMTAFVFLSF